MERKFTLTTAILKEWFYKFNDLYFDGELPMVSFKFSNATSFWGQYCWNNGKPWIKMSIHKDRTERDFQNTFIHEMIHHWQRIHNYTDVHGGSFKMKAYQINRLGGWNIKRCSDGNGAEVVSGMEKGKECATKTYLFTWTTDKGKKLFRPARVSCIDNLKRQTKTNTKFYNDVCLYMVKYTDELKRYREAVSSLGGYEIDTFARKTMVENLIAEGTKVLI